MEILVVAAELAPYVSSSAAAETVQSLSKALRLLGHEVTLAVPRYPAFERAGLMAARRLTPLSLEGGAEAHIFDAQLASGTKLVLFDAPVLFAEPPDTNKSDLEEAKRLGFYARAVEALVRSRSEQGGTFDVVHAHDRPGALALIHLVNSPGPALAKVLTIHCPEDTRSFPLSAASALGLSHETCQEMSVQRGDTLNVLTGGIACADIITVPGETLANDLASGAHGTVLAASLQDSGKPLFGILGGIDYAHYNPATDTLLETRFDAEDASRKGINQSKWVRELGLQLSPGRPLLGCVGPFSVSGYSDVTLSALRAVLKQELAVAVLGPLPENTKADYESLVADFSDRCALVVEPDAACTHKALAACDLWLSPSVGDPSGAWVMRAQRYGALPIVLAAGAAGELVVDCDPELETGTGFLFEAATTEDVVAAVRRGMAALASPRRASLVRRVMRRDVGWDRPARRYVQLFRQALSAKS